MKKVNQRCLAPLVNFLKEKYQDLKFKKKIIQKEGLFNIFAEYMFSIKHVLIYNKIEEFGKFIWK